MQRQAAVQIIVAELRCFRAICQARHDAADETVRIAIHFEQPVAVIAGAGSGCGAVERVKCAIGVLAS